MPLPINQAASKPGRGRPPFAGRALRRAGFTFVEMLVAICIGAIAIAAAAVAFNSIVVHGPKRTVAVNVDIGAGTFNSFYGENQTSIAASQAPDYAAAAMAESLREWFSSDVSSAIAVFSLGRNGLSSAVMRPSTLAVATNFDARTLNSPEAFRAFFDPGATVFSPYTGASAATNASTYILGRSTNSATVAVRAIYETDFVTTTDPPGVYASVRRYEGATLTGYYHVFYPGQTNSFSPLAAYFEREALVSGVAANDVFKKAARRPFYFLWWPDPAVPTLDYRGQTETIDANQPRATYYQMGSKTSFFFVVPAFPPL